MMINDEKYSYMTLNDDEMHATYNDE